MHQNLQPGAPWRSTVSILLIDSDPANRDVASTILRYAGFRVLEAEGPDTGLQYARRTRPTLIVTELFQRSGGRWHILEDLASMKETANIPVLAYSSYAFPADEEAARRSGVVRYLAKPRLPQEFEAVVEEILQSCDMNGPQKKNEAGPYHDNSDLAPAVARN